MSDDEKEEPGILDKALNYVRGKAAAADQVKNRKHLATPNVDPDKAKEVEDSFKKAF